YLNDYLYSVKRRVIKQGTATLTISLPSVWTKKFDIKPGDEIEVDERGKELCISSDSYFSPKKTQLDISGFSIPMIRHCINGMYIRGDDELRIIFDKPELIDIIQNCIDFNIGFAMIKQEKNSCTVKDISGSTDSEFDNMLKRIFYMIISFGEDGLEIIKKGEPIKDFWKRDLAIDKYIYYTLRMLNKKGHPQFEKTKFYYDILLLLEHLADEYNRLYKNTENTKLSKEAIKTFEDVNHMFRDFFDNFYKFEQKKSNELILKRNEIRNKLLKAKSNDDIIVIYYLRKIAEMIINILQVQLQLVL
ncbi:MAG: hypothetical protein KKF95_03515, partial [Nanoarchaeota archaeon]|nr:hypothetical protein [Nanoarchaeota archaeon]